jgi:hypothetical protein
MKVKKGTTIQDCTFYGVKFDGLSAETLLTIAKCNASIVEIFKANNVQIKSLISVDAVQEPL